MTIKAKLGTLWKFDGTAWTWVAGNKSENVRGTYGFLGVPNANNYPGARLGAVVAKDSQNNIWMFGGLGIDGYNSYGMKIGDL